MQKIIAIALLAALASGCATITRGTHQAFTVESEPSGAHVSLSLGMTCDATPCVFQRIDREASFTVTVTKDGYKPWSGGVAHQTAGGGAAGMAGNVILGGIIGAAIDANSGATQELVPNPLHVTLEPLNAVAAAPAAAPAADTPAPAASAAPASALGAPPATPAPTTTPAPTPAPTQH